MSGNTEFIFGTKKRRCQAHVSRYQGLANYSGQCENAAKRGKDYCGVHDPKAKAARDEKAAARWKRQREKWRDESFGKRFRDVLEAIESGHNDPRSAASAILEIWRGNK